MSVGVYYVTGLINREDLDLANPLGATSPLIAATFLRPDAGACRWADRFSIVPARLELSLLLMIVTKAHNMHLFSSVIATFSGAFWGHIVHAHGACDRTRH